MDKCPDGPARCERTGVSERWSLSGYDVLHLVEGGSAGDLWCAREQAGGELVALRRVGGGPHGSPDVEALRRTVPLQADLPYAVRLRDVVDDGQVLVLVLDLAEGGALEAVLSRRGSLEPGEVVTIGVPLALALAAGAERGLVHGELSASSVWFGADGRPLLAGLGLSRAPADPADDVAALATLCLGLLRPVADPGPDVAALVEALELGRSPDPAERPDAARLAALLRRAHPPGPVRLQAGTYEGQQARAAEPALRRRRPSPGQLVASALVLLVLAGAAAGWWSGRGGEQPAPVAAAQAAPSAGAASEGGAPAGEVPTAAGSAGAQEPADWAAVLDGLNAVRAQAFASGDADVLRRVYVPGSDGLVADLRLLGQLSASGRTAAGVRHVLGEVEVLTAGADRTRLRMVDTLPAYDVRDAEGAVVARAAGRGERSQVVELALTPGGWRLVSLTPD